MSEHEWIARWEGALASMALRGLVFDTDRSTIGNHSAGQYALTIPDKVKTILGQMWATAQQPLPAKVTLNGAAQQQGVKR